MAVKISPVRYSHWEVKYGGRDFVQCCPIGHHPQISLKLWSLLSKGIAGKRGKSYPLVMIVSQVKSVFESLCFGQ
jgi:hypothetical protein